jgi:hypothetical protein
MWIYLIEFRSEVFFRNFMIFKLLLRDFLIRKSFPCKPTGEESMQNITPLTKLVLLTLFSVLMLINRMEKQKENMGIWSK